jgi:menaquinol-cytochrome c reductase iron-sulfur subunit
MPDDDLRIADTDRRRLLLWTIHALLGVAAAAIATPIAAFVLRPLRKRPDPLFRPVGAVSDFAVGATVRVTFAEPDAEGRSGLAGQGAAYVRRTTDDRFEAFSVYCTHTGCPVHWLEGARLFVCPCHGGSFGEDGSVRGGPPPAPLARHEVRVDGGLVQLRTRPIPFDRRVDRGVDRGVDREVDRGTDREVDRGIDREVDRRVDDDESDT